MPEKLEKKQSDVVLFITLCIWRHPGIDLWRVNPENYKYPSQKDTTTVRRGDTSILR